MTPSRILALMSDGLGVGGGIARFNQNLLAAFSRSAAVHEVVVLPRRGSPEADVPPRILQMPSEPSKLRWAMCVVQQARWHRFDIVFCGHINFVPLAALVARHCGARLWLHIHGIEAWQPPGRLVRPGLASADLVTSASRFTRGRMLAWSGLAADRVKVLPNTLPESFRSTPRRSDLVERHRLLGRRVVLTVGRLASTERYKGHDRLIRALPSLAGLHPDIAYLIVGSGDDEPRLAAMARDAGVAELVRFAGEVPDRELPDYFALADVFAMPSTGEGFGIVFLEAAACGLPVIGGCRDGSRDALADGQAGVLIDPLDEGQLIDAVASALGQPHGAAPFRGDDRRHAIDRFRFGAFARHVDDLVGWIVNR